MKKSLLLPVIMVTAMAFLNSCGPSVTLTSWKNPKEESRISNVLVWGMFDKIEYQKPFEQYATAYLNKQGFKAVQSLQFLPPGTKYELADLEQKFDNQGVDGILVVTYLGTDKKETYVPPTTSVYPNYYYNYYNYYNWGYPIYGAGANVVTTGGYWNTTSTLNLRANLYSNSSNGLLWTAEISIVDPEHVDQATVSVISRIYNDWKKNGLLKMNN